MDEKGEKEMITVNGKEYPMWSQFVENKEKWIGGSLEDFGDSMDRAFGMLDDERLEEVLTEIVDIELKSNGTDSAMFNVVGKNFTCGFDVEVGGVTAGEDGWITFSGYGGHKWRIKERKNEKDLNDFIEKEAKPSSVEDLLDTINDDNKGGLFFLDADTGDIKEYEVPKEGEEK